MKAVQRRELAAWMQERFKVNVRRSCRLALLRPSVWYAKSEARDQSALRLRIREIAMDRPRFGYLRVLVMLKREGWEIGKHVGEPPEQRKGTPEQMRKAEDEAWQRPAAPRR